MAAGRLARDGAWARPPAGAWVLLRLLLRVARRRGRCAGPPGAAGLSRGGRQCILLAAAAAAAAAPPKDARKLVSDAERVFRDKDYKQVRNGAEAGPRAPRSAAQLLLRGRRCCMAVEEL